MIYDKRYVTKLGYECLSACISGYLCNSGIEIDGNDIVLNSIKAIEMVVIIESEFTILFGEEELLVHNINTINKVVEIINKTY